MSFKYGSRVPYARVLYAAAVAALLSACSQSDVQSNVEPAAGRATIHLSETTSEMPEVVITASRTQPEHIG